MGEDTNQIERDIRQTRSELGRNLDELGDKARELVSWRSQYRDHSRLFLGAAFGAGLVFGLAAISGRRNGYAYDTDELPQADVIGGETYAVGLPPINGVEHVGTLARAKSELGETWAAIADGLVRTASAKAVQVLSELVPGFGNHVEGRYAMRGSRHWDERGAD